MLALARLLRRIVGRHREIVIPQVVVVDLQKLHLGQSPVKSELKDSSGFGHEPIANSSSVDLFCENSKELKRLLAKGNCNRYVSGIATYPDENSPNSTAVMPCIKGVPLALQINLKPGA